MKIEKFTVLERVSALQRDFFGTDFSQDFKVNSFRNPKRINRGVKSCMAKELGKHMLYVLSYEHGIFLIGQ